MADDDTDVDEREAQHPALKGLNSVTYKIKSFLKSTVRGAVKGALIGGAITAGIAAIVPIVTTAGIPVIGPALAGGMSLIGLTVAKDFTLAYLFSSALTGLGVGALAGGGLAAVNADPDGDLSDEQQRRIMLYNRQRLQQQNAAAIQANNARVASAGALSSAMPPAPMGVPRTPGQGQGVGV